MPQLEHHYIHRSGWLRAAVLGANDGIISISSLLVGLAAANVASEELLLTGIAATVAGAFSMAAGEYVSVSSQADIEHADRSKEIDALKQNWEEEVQELSEIYQSRGLDPQLSIKVATQLMKHDPVKTHLRDELGIHENLTPQPIKAAIFSALAFIIGAFLPVAVSALLIEPYLIFGLVGACVAALTLLGSFSAQLGGAHKAKAALRVTLWGLLAMCMTFAVGLLLKNPLS